MKLQRDELGMIPADYPKVFYRVYHWMTGAFIADFSNEAEAVEFSYVRNHGGRYDHKVATMRMTAR